MISKSPLFILLVFLFGACSKDNMSASFDTKGYPEEIGNIIINKCATAGCHNDLSKLTAGGLSLESWDKMFEGSIGGSPVIPYRPDQSYLMYSISVDSAQGISLTPTMPLNQPSLTTEEYTSIKNWISNGAADKNGLVKFSDDPDRRKYYVTNQGCDMVAVFDANSQILMRYIDVGSRDEIESPHQVEVSPDGKYWYTIFFTGSTIQKYSTEDDRFVSEVEIGTGSWNTMSISSDSKHAYIVNWDENGTIAIVDLERMELIQTIGTNGLLEWPHGSLIDDAEKVLYVTAQHGNFIYKIDLKDMEDVLVEKISLNGVSPTVISWLDPHDIVMSPDGSKYFVTCEESNEVRIVQTSNDSLLAVIPTGEFPQEMSLSSTSPYLFVSCTEDVTSYPGKIGSVHIIDYSNNTLLKTIHTGSQPHGLTVDDKTQLVYVAHRNINDLGPAPHHITNCEGRNGYMTLIDMNTLELVSDYKVEILVDAYSVSLRD